MKRLLALAFLAVASFGQLVTVATPQPQPAVATYNTSALTTYPQYTRSSYIAVTGRQAPNYDGTMPTKLWSATDATAFGWYPPASETFTTFTMTAAQAAAVNIPGVQTFPPYTIAPTTATQVGPLLAQPNAIPAGSLATMAQGIAMAEAWGMSPPAAAVAVSDTYNTQFAPFSISYNGDSRQWLTINWNGLLINVGEMLQSEYANGVGAPGSWTNTVNPAPGTNPVWVSVPAVNPPVNPSGPVPMRQLNSDGATNEAWVATLGGLEIANTAVPSAASNPTGSGTGGLTPLQAQQLQQALDGINTLLSTFGKPAAQ